MVGARDRAPRFDACAHRVLKRLRFPPRATPLTLRYPLLVDEAR